MGVLAVMLPGDCDTAIEAFQLISWILSSHDLSPATRRACCKFVSQPQGIGLVAQLMNPKLTAVTPANMQAMEIGMILPGHCVYVAHA